MLNKIDNIFFGRPLLIATMHKKEDVISPLCTELLGVKTVLPKDFNSDKLGTFSGEIERVNNPIEAARKKCIIALENSNADLAIASEGSFGQHPSIMFAPADDEIVLLYDKKNNIEIIGIKLSTETNFGGKEVKSMAEAHEVAKQFKFDSHALILRDEQNSFSKIYKGITSKKEFNKYAGKLLDENGKLWIETDMRAMYNPMRMQVIKEATTNLVEKALSKCPQCFTPGFSVTDVIKGLPCELCEAPTNSTLAHHLTCQKCDFTKINTFPHQKHVENPMYCSYCNP